MLERMVKRLVFFFTLNITFKSQSLSQLCALCTPLSYADIGNQRPADLHFRRNKPGRSPQAVTVESEGFEAKLPSGQEEEQRAV